MKVHVPVCFVIYQSVEVPDDVKIELIDDDLLDEKMKGLKIPHGHGISLDTWKEHFAVPVSEGEIVSGFLGKLFDMREIDPGIKAEISPCFGSVPFKDMN